MVSNDIMSNDINALGDTSVAFSANNIPQPNQNVKSDTLSNNNNMQNSNEDTINTSKIENKKTN